MPTGFAVDTGILKDPVIETEPVNWWVLVNRDPLTLDPVIYSLDDVTSCTFIV